MTSPVATPRQQLGVIDGRALPTSEQLGRLQICPHCCQVTYSRLLVSRILLPHLLAHSEVPLLYVEALAEVEGMLEEKDDLGVLLSLVFPEDLPVAV